MQERPNRIRYFRRLADLSQDQLAQRLGVHKQTVSDWERGIFNPALETAFALARELGCSTDDLFMPAVSGDVHDDSGTEGATAPASGAGERVVDSAQPDRTGAAAGAAKLSGDEEPAAAR
jgi:putative transcriptional regulator